MEQQETHCEEFRLILDQEEKTVIVEPMRPGARLKLTKDGAQRMAGLLLGQVRDW